MDLPSGCALGLAMVKKNRSFFPELSRRWTYPLAGAFLALGAPSGLFLLRCLDAGAFPSFVRFASEWKSDPLTYRYLTFATLVVFLAIGRVLGLREDALETSSITDSLTGLFNRRHIHDRLREELARSERHGTRLAILLIDVDHLKRINDQGGHEAGDVALSMVAESLRRACRATDIPGRFGGDEFVVLAPSTSASDAMGLARRIRSTLLRQHERSPGTPVVSVSIGVADIETAGKADAAALFEAADRALYEAKAEGRDREVLSVRHPASKPPESAGPVARRSSGDA
jgi:diguanylate cyclase (GGDEF)-like protein